MFKLRSRTRSSRTRSKAKAKAGTRSLRQRGGRDTPAKLTDEHLVKLKDAVLQKAREVNTMKNHNNLPNTNANRHAVLRTAEAQANRIIADKGRNLGKRYELLTQYLNVVESNLAQSTRKQTEARIHNQAEAMHNRYEAKKNAYLKAFPNTKPVSAPALTQVNLPPNSI